MTVAKLMEALKKYPKDSQVVFTLPGAKHLYWTDKLWTGIDGCPVLECEDSVEFEDVVGLAQQCKSENEIFLTFAQEEALNDFIVTAEEIENES